MKTSWTCGACNELWMDRMVEVKVKGKNKFFVWQAFCFQWLPETPYTIEGEPRILFLGFSVGLFMSYFFNVFIQSWPIRWSFISPWAWDSLIHSINAIYWAPTTHIGLDAVLVTDTGDLKMNEHPRSLESMSNADNAPQDYNRVWLMPLQNWTCGND